METESSTRSTFAQALGDLKRRGSNILVVGGPAPAAHEAACERLLGETDSGRDRLLVLTDGSFDRSAAHEGHVDASVLTFPSATRGGATAAAGGSGGPSAPAAPSPDATRQVPERDLAALAAAVDDELDATDDAEPGGLRLCLDSLLPILEEHERGEVKRFLTAVGNRVRAVRGMGHYHLPIARDADAVRDIESAFDAVVEVRTDAEGARQRWHIPEDGIDSGWLEL